MAEARSMAEQVARARDGSASRPVSLWDREDRWLIRHLLPRLVALRVRLTLRDYGRTQAELASRLKHVPVEVPDEGALQRAVRAGRVVRGLGRRMPFDAACLVQSLALWSFLREQGLPADLRIGVTREEALAAHAWVELFDEPITESPQGVARFGTFDRIGS